MLLETLAVAAFTLGLWLAGLPLARSLLGAGRGAEEAVLAPTLALALVPTLALAASFLGAGALMGRGMMLAAAALLAAAPLIGACALPRTLPRPGRVGAVVVALAAAVFLLHLALDRYPPTPMAESFWNTCTYEAVYDAMGVGNVTWLMSSVLEEPGPVYYYPRSPLPLPPVDRPPGMLAAYYLAPTAGLLPQNFLSYGYVGIKDQRIGNTALFSLPVSYLGAFGFRYAGAAFAALACAWVFLLACNLAGSPWIAALAIPLVGLSLLDLSHVLVQPDHLFGLALSASVLHLALNARGPRRWFAAGLLFGVLVGVRDVAVLLAPALGAALWRRGGWKGAAALAAGAALAAFPWMYWHAYAYGNPFTSEALQRGFVEPFEHSLLGVRLRLPVLLNWPFIDRVVRTPAYPFPVAVFLPLALMRTMGWLLLSLLVPGAALLGRREPRTLAVALLWALPLWLFLSVQEDWNEHKTALVLLVVPAVVPVALAGLRRPRPVLVAAGLAALAAGALLARGLDVPGDARWRLVNRLESPPGPEELGRWRGELTAPRLLPSLRPSIGLDPRGALADLEGAGPLAGIGGSDCYLPRFHVDDSVVALDLSAAERGEWRLSLMTRRWAGRPEVGREGDAAVIRFSGDGRSPCTLIHVDVAAVSGDVEVRVREAPGASCGVMCSTAREGGESGSLRILPPPGARRLVLRHGQATSSLELSPGS